MSFRIVTPTKIYVKNSPIHGLGVFACEKIYKGEIFVWYGDVNYWNDGRSSINVVN